MADVTVLWENAVFEETEAEPWTDNVIAISPTVNNDNNAYNALDVTLTYEDFLPDGKNVQMGSTIVAVLEELIKEEDGQSPAIWAAVAQQGKEVKGSDDAPNHIMRHGPQTIVDFAPIAISVGPTPVTYITNSAGSLAGRTRIKLIRVIHNADRALHTRVQVSAVAREYDM